MPSTHESCIEIVHNSIGQVGSRDSYMLADGCQSQSHHDDDMGDGWRYFFRGVEEKRTRDRRGSSHKLQFERLLIAGEGIDSTMPRVGQ
jgi:hypothetical protein